MVKPRQLPGAIFIAAMTLVGALLYGPKLGGAPVQLVCAGLFAIIARRLRGLLEA